MIHIYRSFERSVPMAFDLQEELKKAEKQLNMTVSRMEQIRSEFYVETIEFIQSWYMKLTEQYVKKDIKLTKQLGIEKLSRLKAEVAALQRNTEKVVGRFLKDDMWWHLNQTEKENPNLMDDLQKATRYIAGKLALILENYGFITTDPNDPKYWREWDYLGIHRPPNAKPFYPHHLDWPGRMIELVNEYMELTREGIQYSYEVKKLKENKALNDVENLWNQA